MNFNLSMPPSVHEVCIQSVTGRNMQTQTLTLSSKSKPHRGSYRFRAFGKCVILVPGGDVLINCLGGVDDTEESKRTIFCR